MKKIFFGLVIIGIAFFAYKYWSPKEAGRDTPIDSRGVPIVFRTEGGLLEVGGFDFTEDFIKQDSWSPWWIYLGTTVSKIQVPARYRYHIELQKEWTVYIKDKVCTVNTPALQPTLPVAFNSLGITKKSEAGWMRFNAGANLAALESSITPELENRARSPQYVGMVREAARKTVAEFIQGWLLREGVEGWKNDADHTVKVIFPGESTESLTLPKIKLENM